MNPLHQLGKCLVYSSFKTKKEFLGYLSAFSGKVADSNQHHGFVPTIFDMLEKNSYFLQEELVISAINEKIEALEVNESYLESKN